MASGDASVAPSMATANDSTTIERARRLKGDDAASSVITLLLIIPLFLGIINIVIVAGQLQLIEADLQQAAREGARVASLRNNESRALTDGRAAALKVVADEAIDCTNADAHINGSDFVPGGRVRLEVWCEVPLADLGVGVPYLGTKRMRVWSWERLERYREFD